MQGVETQIFSYPQFKFWFRFEGDCDPGGFTSKFLMVYDILRILGHFAMETWPCFKFLILIRIGKWLINNIISSVHSNSRN